eukprot:422183-Prymnesium_polylepis.1
MVAGIVCDGGCSEDCRAAWRTCAACMGSRRPCVRESHKWCARDLVCDLNATRATMRYHLIVAGAHRGLIIPQKPLSGGLGLIV